MSVPDEGFSRNASCALNSISTFLYRAIFGLINILAYLAYDWMTKDEWKITCQGPKVEGVRY